MWLYEPDEVPKKKHHWKQDHAGFVTVKNVVVSKCPNSMALEYAQDLINHGVEWSPVDWPNSYPQRIYAIDNGVLYRAMPTNPGRSYHGFPEHYEKFPKSRGSNGLKEKILTLAAEYNCVSEIRGWMRW